MEEWKEYKATDFCKNVTDGTHDSPKQKSEGYYLVTSKHIKGNTIDFDSAYKISKEDYNKIIQRSKVDQWDVIISMIGAYCGFCYLEKSTKTDYAIKNVGLFKVGSEIKSKWLYYYLSSPAGQNKLHLLRTGSSQPYIALNSLRNITIPVPDEKTMRSIVLVLQSLDDKIEVNRQINDNLEQQAQALFKSWFVDFEPFKDGEFVESELGMIPKGWRVGKLGELCTFKRGKNLLTKDAIDEGVPVVAGGLEPSCYHNVSNTKSPVVTVSGSGANAGFMRMYYQEVWASDCSFIDSTCKNLLFVYCFLAINKKLLRHAQTGAVQPHVKPSDIHDFDIVIPPQAIIEEFQTKIDESIHLRGNIEKENIRLTTLRDTLLPKLMLGELKVNEVEI